MDILGNTAAATALSKDLDAALAYLYEELEDYETHDLRHLYGHDIYLKITFLKRLLCVRPANPPLPTCVLKVVDTVSQYDAQRRPRVDLSKLRYANVRRGGSDGGGPQLTVWKGDIRNLAHPTAIVNAANSQLLGCFQPEHACIDNAIHSSAGPQLREACFEIMSRQGKPEAEGCAKVTPGFNLSAKHVIHTVGPQIRGGQSPTAEEAALLASCYVECLRAAEKLPADRDGHKSIVFCGISTGLFGFPLEQASEIAVQTVLEYFEDNRQSSITHVVFDAFSDTDLHQYLKILKTQGITFDPPTLPSQHSCMPDSRLELAKGLFDEADFVIVSAGAGLSADAGLDYTSREVFQKHLPGFMKYGFRRLYDVFGFADWPTPAARWSYLVNHLRMIHESPQASIYQNLRRLLLGRFRANSRDDEISHRYFIRTTNADGFFIKNGYSEDLISTPQGQYAFLQCVNKCRPDATFPSKPYLEAAFPFIDPATQHLPAEFEVPSCVFCGAGLVLCVRGGDYFNDRPFRKQEQKYRQLVKILAQDPSKKVLLLELGVGMNTPSVLRWHNENLVRRYPSNFKLIRVGLGSAGSAPLDLEGASLAAGIEDRIASFLPRLGGRPAHSTHAIAATVS